MKKLLTGMLFCCLAVVFLLSGCTPKSPLLTHADDDTGLNQMFVETYLGVCKGYSIENAEGQTLRYANPESSNKTMNYVKTARISEYGDNSSDFDCYFIPFSYFFKVRSDVKRTDSNAMMIPQKPSSSVTYLTDRGHIKQSASGYWSTATHHCNNVIELEGDLQDFSLSFTIVKYKGTTGRYDYDYEYECTYLLEGSGKDYAIVALVDDEIKTEGMAGNYTVLRSEQGHRIRKEYDETGNLLSTREE